MTFVTLYVPIVITQIQVLLLLSARCFSLYMVILKYSKYLSFQLHLMYNFIDSNALVAPLGNYVYMH